MSVLYQHTDGKVYTAELVGSAPLEVDVVDPYFPAPAMSPLRLVEVTWSDLVPTCSCGSPIHTPAESVRCG